jgi:AT hook motif
MDITKMLAELKAEREGIEQAIIVLERLASGRGKRRGRPPKWMTGQKRRGRPPGSENKPKQ